MRRPARKPTPLTPEQRERLLDGELRSLARILALKFWRRWPRHAGHTPWDLEQEALIGLGLAVQTWNPAGAASLKTYAGVVIRNTLLNLLKRALRPWPAPLDQEFDAALPTVDPLLGGPLVEEALALLPPTEKRLARRCWLEGVTHGQAGRELGVSRQRVTTLLDQARQRLRRLLGGPPAGVS